jgi:hypothetical protein
MTTANMVLWREIRLRVTCCSPPTAEQEQLTTDCWPRGAASRHSSLPPAAPKGGQLPNEGSLWPPGQFGRIPGKRSSLAVTPDLDQREVAEATVVRGRSVQVVTRINDLIYWIQRHPRARTLVVHLDRLAPCLGATRGEQPRIAGNVTRAQQCKFAACVSVVTRGCLQCF